MLISSIMTFFSRAISSSGNALFKNRSASISNAAAAFSVVDLA